MEEKIYKLMKNSGITTLAIGIAAIISGLSAGVLLIITGAKLLKNKEKAFH